VARPAAGPPAVSPLTVRGPGQAVRGPGQAAAGRSPQRGTGSRTGARTARQAVAGQQVRRGHAGRPVLDVPVILADRAGPARNPATGCPRPGRCSGGRRPAAPHRTGPTAATLSVVVAGGGSGGTGRWNAGAGRVQCAPRPGGRGSHRGPGGRRADPAVAQPGRAHRTPDRLRGRCGHGGQPAERRLCLVSPIPCPIGPPRPHRAGT
jgi:hypothetical protein